MAESWWQRQKKKSSTFWIGVLLVGPFALPLLWRDEKKSTLAKVVISFAVIALTVVLLGYTYLSALDTIQVMQELQRNLEGAGSGASGFAQ